jgi:putative sigma-54 modulation protein
MNIQISGSHIDLTEAIKTYVTEKIEALQKYYPEMITAKVDLGMTTKHHNKGAELFEAKVMIHAAGQDFRATATEGDLYAAIDEVQNELKTVLRRHKEKLRDLHRQPRPDKQ